jgi:hypothetical protein
VALVAFHLTDVLLDIVVVVVVVAMVAMVASIASSTVVLKAKHTIAMVSRIVVPIMVCAHPLV